ncbi:glycoside hydrolase family 16 protein [Sediminibacterium sp.]|uniref:glycoside hydrolase family 16 protein n=1 Tax=Sediminibacterium sp. TaxID=1917865 RepID=UPI003F6A295A
MYSFSPFNRLIKAAVLSVAFFMSADVALAQPFKKLVWSDEFNGTGLPDANKWGYDTAMGCPKICGWGNNELQYYTHKNTRNVRQENGMLVVEAHKEKMGNAQYTSARIVTKNKGDWKYGRIEVRAKLPAGRGMWPAIWMLPTDAKYGGWPHSGEIDIMENVGYWPDSVLATVHTNAFNGMKGTQKTKGLNFKDLSTAFHVYSIEWDATKIRFYVDDQLCNEFKNTGKGKDEWPFDQRFHLLINIAVGGNWGGAKGVDDSIFPQKMFVDYVRVYQ